ncbi:MAG: hypothetical protein ABIK86_02550 [candidate division WOR-3 bacterium]
MTTAVVWALLALYTPPSPSFDPGRNWFTLETPNFDVHFSSRGKLTSEAADLARDIARICEEVRATLAKSTGYSISEPVQVVVTDFYDYSNGWAAPFPYPTIRIIPTPPAGSRVGDDNWLRTLILHEYSHLLQLSRAEGPILSLRRLFGSVVLPNALLPSWLVEGYAIYNETRFSNSGRLRSPSQSMMLKAAADAGRLLTIDQCDGYELQRWPGGNAPYLYGSRFLAHLAGPFPPGIWDEFNQRHAQLLPFCENAVARALLGRRFDYLWRSWQTTLTPEKPARTSSLQHLTEHGSATGSPCWSRSGTELFYICRTDRERTAIRALDIRSRTSRVLYRGDVFGPLALSPDGRLLAFSEFRIVRNGALVSDISVLDIASGTVRRLTTDRHARDPDFAPDTSLLLFVSSHGAQNDLVLLDLSTGDERHLTQSDSRTVYSSPRLSPGGRWIAVSVSRPGGFSDIELIDRNSGWSVSITNDRATDLSPAWSRTGKTLFFVSDRSGRFDIYACSVEDRRIYLCKTADYGVFEPAVSPDNQTIALVTHSAFGDDIAITPLDVHVWRPAADFVDTLPAQDFAATTVEPGLYYYNPYPTVVPRFWLPWLGRGSGWEIGAFTVGWDALQYHSYSLIGGWLFADATPFLAGRYTWSRFRPSVTLTTEATLSRQKVGINLGLPFVLTSCSHWLDFGPSVVRDSLVALELRYAWLYSDARSYRFCVAPVEGMVTGIGGDAGHRSLFGSNNRARVVGHMTKYLGLPPSTWSLRCRAAAGVAFGDTSRHSAFALSDETGLLRVRGFPGPGSPGSGAAVASLQFRVPLWWPERGIDIMPVFLRNLNAAVFCDAGSAWQRFELADVYTGTRLGTGVELRADLFVLRYVPLRVTAGVAVGLMPGLSRQLYVRVDSEMLATLVSRTPTDWRIDNKAPEPD